MEVDHPLGLGEAARVRGVGGHLRLRHVVAEPLEDPAEEARAAPSGAGDEDERPLGLARGRLVDVGRRGFGFLRDRHWLPGSEGYREGLRTGLGQVAFPRVGRVGLRRLRRRNPREVSVTERLEAPDASALVAEPEERFPNHIEQRTIVLAEQRVLYLPVPKAGLDDHRLAPRRGRRPSLRPLRALDAARRLDVPDHPRHEPLGARLSARRLRGRGARADPHRGRLVPVLGRTEPVAAPLVGLAVEAPPPRAALLRDVLARSRGSRASPSSPRTWSRTSAALPPRWRPAMPWTSTGRSRASSSTACRSSTSGGSRSSTRRWRSCASTWAAANWPTEQRQENRTPVPLPPAAYDEEAAAALNGHYAEDFERYGYEPVDSRRGRGRHEEMERAGGSAAPDHQGHDRQARPHRAAPPGRTARAVPGGAAREPLLAPGRARELADPHEPREPHRLQRRLGLVGGRHDTGLHRRRPREERGRPAALGPAAPPPRRRADRARGQRLDRRHA